jgi:transposase
LGNWHTTYTRFKRWGESGVWQRVVEAVSGDRDMEALMIDSTAVRAHQHAAGAKKRRFSSDRPFARRIDEQDSCSR